MIESFGKGSLQRDHRIHQYLDRIDESTWFAEEEEREKFVSFRAKVKQGTYEVPAQPRQVRPWETLTIKFRFTNKESQNLYLRHN
eukprot:648924-Pyramimonas_sp.AAC.1